MLTRNIAIGLIIGGTLGGLAIGGTTGWTLNGWRLSGKVSKLEGKVETQQQTIATLEGANGRCTAAVGDVRGSVQQLVDENLKRSNAATKAMEKAAGEAKGHLAAAAAAMGRAAPKAGDECTTLARELLDYARRRKAAP